MKPPVPLIQVVGIELQQEYSWTSEAPINAIVLWLARNCATTRKPLPLSEPLLTPLCREVKELPAVTAKIPSSPQEFCMEEDFDLGW